MTGIADVFTPEADLGPEWSAARPPAPRRGRVIRRVLRNPAAVVGLVIVLLIVLMAVFAPLLAPYNPDVQDLLGKLKPPSSAHWLGTDEYGRDLLSRLMYGARVSLLAATEAVAIGCLVGTTLGMIAGFRGGRFDSMSSRVFEITLALPGFLIAVTVVGVFGPGLTTVMAAVGFLLTPVFFRVSRAATQDVREETYIEGSRALGCTTRRIVVRHVLPNAIAPVVVQVAILFGVAITLEASLSFLGLGAQAPTASWGSMLSNANSYMSQAPYLMYIPGAMIAITVLAFSLLGDGLAAALGTSRSSLAERGR
ncbi:MAG: ABC transporter permease [Acidimicrobiia bacterium]